MAIATTQGHVQRALEFFNKAGKYFIVGGTEPWGDTESEANPPSPSTNDYKLRDIVGLKKVDNCYLVVPDPNGTISYRTQNWRIVLPPFKTTTTSNIVSGTNIVSVTSISGLTVGSKVRVDSTYEATITRVSTTDNQIEVDTSAPTNISSGATVEGGALVEGAKYIYVDCYLNYDQFPIVTYRQIGLCTEVTPDTQSVLRSAAYATAGINEYTSSGVLEIIDNRPPSTRDIDQRESLSLVIEF